MRRRYFIQFIASSAAAWPFVAQAQQTAMPVIGFLRSTSEADSTNFVTSFRQGLEETEASRRGQERRNRIPLCGQSIRSPFGSDGRSGSTAR